MEVSKHHARIFAIVRKKQPDMPPCFSITDTGSTHGTYVYRPDHENPKPIHPSSVHRISEESFHRLSPEKHASRPYNLQHLDLLRFGLQSNIFEVHIHGNAWASCPACQISPDGTNEISVAPQAQSRKVPSEEPVKPRPGLKNAVSLKNAKHKAHHETRQHLKTLKNAYLKPISASAASVDERPMYRDRASIRRERYPDMPPVRPQATSSEVSASSAPVPLDASNVGYQILAKMVDGAEHIPDQQPIAPKVGTQRAGLGSQHLVDPHETSSYQDRARAGAQHRYQSM